MLGKMGRETSLWVHTGESERVVHRPLCAVAFRQQPQRTRL